MPLDSARVIWSDGLFIRPHHFQQLERHFEHLVERRFAASEPADFGFLKIEVDTSLLRQGKVHVAAAVGVFPDGTPFELPAEECILRPFDVPEGTRDQIVYLNVVLQRAAARTVSLEKFDAAGRRMRYVALDARVVDSSSRGANEADVKVGALHLQIDVVDAGDGGECSSMPIARILERRADGEVVLDEKFIPPLLHVGAHRVARQWLDELAGIVRQRAAALAARLSGPATRGVGEFSDFMMLVLCNRYDPLIAHLRELSPLHPLVMYRELLKFAGECSTYGRENRLPPAFPPYSHVALDASMAPVIDEIRRALSKVIGESAVQIPLEMVRPGLYRALINDDRLIASAQFVLAVGADVERGHLKSVVSTQVKIGPTESLRDLVTLNLPGIGLESLPVAPRQMPYVASQSYFELDPTAASMWKAIQVSRALGIYVPGSLPGAELQLWAIRS